jgi:hypothetical protein
MASVGGIMASPRLKESKASDDTVQVALRKSTVEMILGYEPSAPTLDDPIEEMLRDHPLAALLYELDREAKGPFFSRSNECRKHGY